MREIRFFGIWRSRSWTRSIRFFPVSLLHMFYPFPAYRWRSVQFRGRGVFLESDAHLEDCEWHADQFCLIKSSGIVFIIPVSLYCIPNGIQWDLLKCFVFCKLVFCLHVLHLHSELLYEYLQWKTGRALQPWAHQLRRVCLGSKFQRTLALEARLSTTLITLFQQLK